MFETVDIYSVLIVDLVIVLLSGSLKNCIESEETVLENEVGMTGKTEDLRPAGLARRGSLEASWYVGRRLGDVLCPHSNWKVLDVRLPSRGELEELHTEPLVPINSNPQRIARLIETDKP